MALKQWTSRPADLHRAACRALLAGLALTGSASCRADAWMLVGSTGSLPNRVVTYANSSSRTDAAPPGVKAAEIMRDHNPKTLDARLRPLRNMKMMVVQVFENPKAPAILRMQMVFDCGAPPRFKIIEAEAVARNKLRHRSSRPDWQPVPLDGWINRSHFVACDEDVWQKPASEDFEYLRAQSTQRQTDRLKLPAHGIALVGDWDSDEGAKIIEFAWKTSFPDGAFVPLNDHRTAAEEAAYQAQLAREEAIRKENERAAPQLNALIAGVEGQLQRADEESRFQQEIASNFRKHSNKVYDTFKGLTEEQLVGVRGAPSAVTTHGPLRLLVYRRTTDTRQEVNVVDAKGNRVGTEVVGQVLNCEVTFKLRVGGTHPHYRVVDYSARQDITAQGHAQCD